jgi:hypothetical protein
MEFRDFGHEITIPICIWNFKNKIGGWEIQRAFQQAMIRKILTLFLLAWLEKGQCGRPSERPLVDDHI